MDYKKLLLNRLLDKFERSKSYLDAGVSRRVMLKLGSADYPEYDIENSTIREIVNAGVMELNKKGILGYEWLKYEQGNIIHRVWLKPERVEDAYQEAGRMAKRKKSRSCFGSGRKKREKNHHPLDQKIS